MRPELGFLALEENQAFSYEAAKAVVVPFGLEASISYGEGTRNGPAAILSASHQVELYDEEFLCEPVDRYGVVTLQEPNIDSTDIEGTLNQLEGTVSTILRHKKFPLVIGGEHTITPGVIRPFLESYDDLIVLHFDAHADLRDEYQGSRFSHAAAIRRVLDHPTVPIVSCGIRNISKDEACFYLKNKHRIFIHWGKDITSWVLKEIVAPLVDRPIYLTFDLDGFDSSLMPSTGTPEPGGLFWADAIRILKRASEVGEIVGADINELAPIDGLHAPNFLASKLAYKILNFAMGSTPIDG